MPDVCTEKHRQIDKQFDVDNIRLNNHSDRIDKLEQSKVKQETDTGYLKDVIQSLEKSISKLTEAIDILKEKPLKKYEQIAMYIILAIVGIVIGRAFPI